MKRIENPDASFYQMEKADEILVTMVHNGKRYHGYLTPLPKREQHNETQQQKP